MNPTYEILIKLEADLQGGKDVTQALKDAKAAANDLGGRYDTTAKKTDALNQSKQRLRDTIKGLSFQIPVLGSLMERFSSGLGGAVALAVGAFVLIRKEIDAFEKALGDAGEDKRFETAVEAKKRALAELSDEMRKFRKEVEEFSADPNDPQRAAKQRITAAENEARRQGDLDKAAVASGRMTQAQADDRAKVRAMDLAAFKDSTRENEVANTSIQRNMTLTELEQVNRMLANLRDPKALASERAAKEKQIADAQKDMDAADEWLNNPVNSLLKHTDHYKTVVRNRDQLRSDIDRFTGQLGVMDGRHKDEQFNYDTLMRQRQRLEERARRLDRQGEEDVLNRPFERDQYRRDRMATAQSTMMTSSPQSEAFKAGQIAMAELLLQAQREAYAVIQQRMKAQRTP